MLRDKDWLINDANLKFYIDQSKIVGGETEPERLTVYNINNNTVLADYFLDPTSGEEPNNAISNHMGRIQRNSDDLGVSYEVNLTHHISNLINKDSTNVSIGLITTQNVLLNGFQKLDTILDPNQNLQTIKTVQRSSVISHEGTVVVCLLTPPVFSLCWCNPIHVSSSTGCCSLGRRYENLALWLLLLLSLRLVTIFLLNMIIFLPRLSMLVGNKKAGESGSTSSICRAGRGAGQQVDQAGGQGRVFEE